MAKREGRRIVQTLLEVVDVLVNEFALCVSSRWYTSNSMNREKPLHGYEFVLLAETCDKSSSRVFGAPLDMGPIEYGAQLM